MTGHNTGRFPGGDATGVVWEDKLHKWDEAGVHHIRDFIVSALFPHLLSE